MEILSIAGTLLIPAKQFTPEPKKQGFPGNTENFWERKIICPYNRLYNESMGEGVESGMFFESSLYQSWKMIGRVVVISGMIFFAMSVASEGSVWRDGSPENSALNTAANAAYLTGNEKAVIFEINKLRADPAGYAKKNLEPLLKLYQGKKLYFPGDVPIVTQEGVAALRDAIQTLRKAPAVSPLSPDFRLTKASRDHRRDQSATGQTGHSGSDGSIAQERIRRYGTWLHAMGENIFYGDADARSVVIHLVIDDGIPGRGHRKNFLNENFRLIGVSCGKHPVWRNVCVMDFAHSFKITNP